MARQALILGTGSHYKFFNTKDSTGAPITLAGTPSLAWRVNGSATQGTSGLTLNVDFDSITGLHQIVLDIDDGTLAAADADEIDVEIEAGTVDAVSVVGTIVWEVNALADDFSAGQKTTLGDGTTVAVNLKNINGTAVVGDGSATPWGP